MKTDKIITQYLTDVSNIHSVSSYVEIYKDTLQNIDLTVKNEILEPQLNNYCGSLENAIERILEYIKTHNVNNKSYFVLAKRINILLSEFQNKIIEKGFKIENGFENEEIKDMYKRIALRVEPNIEKKYLPHAYELEKKFKKFIKIKDVEQKKPKVKEIHPKENNQFDEIFSNNGFELFSYILENHIAKKGIRGRINDLSFYYWSMFNSTPKYIHQRPETFKRWFCETYEDNFNKLKTYEEAKDQKGNRKRHFQTSLDWFKTQK